MAARNGDMAKRKKYLFVCRANADRSKSAEDLCRGIAQHKGLAIDTTSAGMSESANNPISQDQADQADLIFVMEEWMRKEMLGKFKQSAGKVICLDIPDEYRRGDVLLQRILRDALMPYLIE